MDCPDHPWLPAKLTQFNLDHKEYIPKVSAILSNDKLDVADKCEELCDLFESTLNDSDIEPLVDSLIRISAHLDTSSKNNNNCNNLHNSSNIPSSTSNSNLNQDLINNVSTTNSTNNSNKSNRTFMTRRNKFNLDAAEFVPSGDFSMQPSPPDNILDDNFSLIDNSSLPPTSNNMTSNISTPSIPNSTPSRLRGISNSSYASSNDPYSIYDNSFVDSFANSNPLIQPTPNSSINNNLNINKLNRNKFTNIDNYHKNGNSYKYYDDVNSSIPINSNNTIAILSSNNGVNNESSGLISQSTSIGHLSSLHSSMGTTPMGSSPPLPQVYPQQASNLGNNSTDKKLTTLIKAVEQKLEEIAEIANYVPPEKLIHEAFPYVDEYTITTMLSKTNYDFHDVCKALRNNTQCYESKPVCRHYLQGNCRRSDCGFSHDVEGKVCKFWINGGCLKGNECEFMHGIDVFEYIKKDLQKVLESVYEKSLFGTTNVITKQKAVIAHKKILDAEFPTLDAALSGSSNDTTVSIKNTLLPKSDQQLELNQNGYMINNLDWTINHNNDQLKTVYDIDDLSNDFAKNVSFDNISYHNNNNNNNNNVIYPNNELFNNSMNYNKEYYSNSNNFGYN